MPNINSRIQVIRLNVRAERPDLLRRHVQAADNISRIRGKNQSTPTIGDVLLGSYYDHLKTERPLDPVETRLNIAEPREVLPKGAAPLHIGNLLVRYANDVYFAGEVSFGDLLNTTNELDAPLRTLKKYLAVPGDITSASCYGFFKQAEGAPKDRFHELRAELLIPTNDLIESDQIPPFPIEGQTAWDKLRNLPMGAKPIDYKQIISQLVATNPGLSQAITAA